MPRARTPTRSRWCRASSTTDRSCRSCCDLLAEAEERAGAPVLRRWVRAAGPNGRPIDHLLTRDFAAFENDLATLADRGFVLRGGRRTDD